jgi:hypothetical protein
LAGPAAASGQELLYLVAQRVDVTGPQREILARQLDPPSTGDLFGQIPAVPDGVHPVAGAMHHERRHGDLRQQRSHVHRARHLGEQEDGTRARPEAVQRGRPLPEGLVVRKRRRRILDQFRAPPVLLHERVELLPLLVLPPQRIVLAPARLGIRPTQDQPADAVGVEHRCRDARGAGIGVPEQRRVSGPRCIEHRQQIGGSFVQRRDLGQPVRESEAPGVHQDEAAETCEAAQEPSDPRLLPEDLEVGDGAGDEQQIGAGRPDHLIGERGAVIPRVRGLRSIHCRIVYLRAMPSQGRAGTTARTAPA